MVHNSTNLILTNRQLFMDYWLLSIHGQILLVYLGEEQVRQYIKIDKKGGRSWSTGITTFNCH
jgi:hypothetical protein